MLLPRPRLAVLPLASLLVLAACGGGARVSPAAPEPPSSKGAERMTVTSTVDDLDQAEQALSRALGDGDRDRSPAPKREETELQAGGACEIACGALASMERAAEHLCGLAGQEDDRCVSARARVTAATERVRSACPACAAP